MDKEPTSGSEPDVQSAPQQLQPAAPRYFMRGAKQQHNEATDGERAGKIRKIVQAMLAQLELTEEDAEIIARLGYG